MNRFDQFWLFLPALTYDLVENRSTSNLRRLLIGFAPLVIWLIFALVYYGFPFPNSAYAKLSTGISRFDYINQGFKYLYDALLRETLMAVTIVSALITGLTSKRHKMQMWTLGILFYLGYLVVVSGDFMRGRLLTVPLFMAVGVLVNTNLFAWDRQRTVVTTLIVLVVMYLGFKARTRTISSGADHGKKLKLKSYDKTYSIAYLREFYFQQHGLLNGKPLNEKTAHDIKALRERQAWEITRIKLMQLAGVQGTLAGPSTHLIDHFAIGDALLARLSARVGKWRIEHFVTK